MNIAAFADDATGALETGAQLAGAGVRAAVCFTGRPPGDAVPVFDTETRHLTAQQAEAAVARAAAMCAGARWVFKKTDSTLRGNIAAEFQALLRAWPGRDILYAPAYPALGRTVRDGALYVYGRPLGETEFARDPLNPVHDGRIAPLLAGLRVRVRDGCTDEDLDAAAREAVESGALAAGTGAFAAHWAAAIPVPRAPRPPRPRPRGPWLAVNGSLHPVSRGQMRALGGWKILQTPAARAQDPAAVLRALAAEAAREIHGAAALLVCGGDTVFALLNELGIAAAEPWGELLPGVALSTLRYGGREIVLVTKAGGFGDETTLARVRAMMEQGS
ncbi:MAG: four-carbon acid sugar kinase family protein [Bryobacteraceae bacterium]